VGIRRTIPQWELGELSLSGNQAYYPSVGIRQTIPQWELGELYLSAFVLGFVSWFVELSG